MDGRYLVATFPTADATSRVDEEHLIPLAFPTNRRVVNNVRNALVALRLVRRLSPSAVVSSGAAPSVSFGVAAALMRVKHFYLEPFDRMNNATVTARLLRRFPATYFLVQWDTQLVGWPRRIRVPPSR